MIKINVVFAKSGRNLFAIDLSLVEKNMEDVEDEELLKAAIALSQTN